VTEAETTTDQHEEEPIPDLFKGPVLHDPWHRWPAGSEPIREIGVRSVDGDASPNYLLRWAVIEIEPGVLPSTRFDRGGESWDLQFIGRWNATWTGNRLTDLSLDCFSEEWPEVVRIVLDPADPIDLLAAYNGSYPGMWSLKLVAEDNPTENARGEIYGHDVSARDPRLAPRIAARYPGIALHTDYFEYEAAHDTEITSEKGLEIKDRALHAGGHHRRSVGPLIGRPALTCPADRRRPSAPSRLHALHLQVAAAAPSGVSRRAEKGIEGTTRTIPTAHPFGPPGANLVPT